MVSVLNSTKAALNRALDRGRRNLVSEGADNNGLSAPACVWEEVIVIDDTLLLCPNSGLFPEAGEELDLDCRLALLASTTDNLLIQLTSHHETMTELAKDTHCPRFPHGFIELIQVCDVDH